MSAPDTGSVARPTAPANNIKKFRARSPAAPVPKPAAAAAAPARPLAPPSSQVVRTLLGAIKSAAPVLLRVGLLTTAVDLLAPRSANQGEVGWLTRRRAEQFVGDLNDGLGVPQALSRLSAGLFVNDISVAKFQAARTGLAEAIARQDRTAALRHFGTIAKAMAFDPSAKSAGDAAVRREIARLKNASVPRPLAPVSPRAFGKAQGASNPSYDALGAGRQAARAPSPAPKKTVTHRLPELGVSSVPARSHSAVPGGKSQITHTRSIGTRSEVETSAWKQREKALENALRIVYERRKTGGVEQIARQVYDALGLQRLGVSKEAFVARASRLGNLPGDQGAGRVRASVDGGAGVIGGGGGLPAPTDPANEAFLALQAASDFPALVGTLNTLREKSGFSNWLNTPEAHDAIVTALSKIWGTAIDLKSGDRTETLATFARAMTRQTAHELAQLGTDVIVRLLDEGGVYWASLNDYNRRLTASPLSAPGTISPDIQALNGAVTLLLQAQGISRPGVPTSESAQSLITDAMGRPFNAKDGRVTSPLLLTPGDPIPETEWEQTGLNPGQQFFAIGDVHGNKDLLEALLKKIGELATARGVSIREFLVVTLGDYLNKGENPAEVLALLSALDMSSQPGNTALDKETERALDELGLLGLGNFIALAGNHEEWGGPYTVHLNKLVKIDRYARGVADMLGKGLIDTIRSYLAEHPDVFSADDRAWLQAALTRYPSPQATGNSDNQRAGWIWKGASSQQGETLDEQEAVDFYTRFRRVWVGAITRVGHLDFIRKLGIAHEAGDFLITHGAPPVTPKQLRDLQAYLSGGTPLPRDTQTHLIWTRAPETEDFLIKYDAIGAPWRGAVVGHTMGGGFVHTEAMSAWALDLGFGRNKLAMLVVKPDGRATLIIARRTAQGIQVFAVRPSEFLPRWGNKPLANRF